MTMTLLDDPPEEPDHDALPAPDGWPAPPAQAAYHGLAGRIVTTIAPHTEADPVAILAQLLVAFGAAAGRGAYFQVEATRHHPNEFLVLVGDSAKARKGSSWDHVRRLLDHTELLENANSERSLTCRPKREACALRAGRCFIPRAVGRAKGQALRERARGAFPEWT